jgi:two-component system response regulator ArlR
MADQPRVLIVEDDATIARAVELELQHAGFAVTRVGDGLSALEAAREELDLIILDLMLPGMDGLDVARDLRASGNEVPILMLTARGDTDDVVRGFDVGADDYVRKPFEIPELMSRIRALLRRSVAPEGAVPEKQTVYKASGVEVDSDRRQATVGGRPISLTAKEFDLLAYLVANAGRVVSRDEILEAVWAGQHSTDSNVIEVFVCHLRNKIDDRDNKVIQTIRGIGYFFARG